MDDVPTPLYITIPWIIIGISISAFYLYLRFKPGHTTMFGPEINLQNSEQEESKKKKI